MWTCNLRAPRQTASPDTQRHVPVPPAMSQIAWQGSSSLSPGFESPTPVALPTRSCVETADKRVCSPSARRNQNRSVGKPGPFSPSTRLAFKSNGPHKHELQSAISSEFCGRRKTWENFAKLDLKTCDEFCGEDVLGKMFEMGRYLKATRIEFF